MELLVVGNKFKVISKRLSYHLRISEVVTLFFLVLLYVVNQRLEDNVQDNWRVVVPSENPF